TRMRRRGRIRPCTPVMAACSEAPSSASTRDSAQTSEPRPPMALNIIKLCVGAASIEDLAQWQKERLREQKARGEAPRVFHGTLQTPKRKAELKGASLYWVIKGVVQVRQALVGFEDGTKEDGSPCCLILLDRKLVPVRPVPRRAFQGWRYLT